jgi:hypothetical protein
MNKNKDQLIQIGKLMTEKIKNNSYSVERLNFLFTKIEDKLEYGSTWLAGK